MKKHIKLFEEFLNKGSKFFTVGDKVKYRISDAEDYDFSGIIEIGPTTYEELEDKGYDLPEPDENLDSDNWYGVLTFDKKTKIGIQENDLIFDEESENTNQLEEREFSKEARMKLSQLGIAMPDGSFPIETVEDLKNAIRSYGRAKDKVAVAKHIAKRAKALGQEDLIPKTPNFQKLLKENLELNEASNLSFTLPVEQELMKDLTPLFDAYKMDVKKIIPDYIQEDGTPSVIIYTYNLIIRGSLVSGQFFNQKDALTAAKLFNETEIRCVSTKDINKYGAIVNKNTMENTLFWNDLKILAEKAKIKLDFDAILKKAKEDFISLK
jgi:hypothetical protein